MKFKFSQIVDKVFINLLIFLIFFGWFKFFNKNIFFSLFLSFLVCLTINLLYRFFTKNKKYKYTVNKYLENDIELYMLSLISNTQKENLSFFKNILNEKFKTEINSYFVIFYQEEKKMGLCPSFEKKDLSFEDALKIVNKAKQEKLEKIFICCYQCASKIKLDLERICNIQIKVLQKKQVYFELFRTSNIYPKINLELKEGQKMKFREVLSLSFSKNKTKAYFFSGLLIFFCSFIVRYNFYYVFMSSILFLFAILSFKNKEEKFEKEIF